MVLDGGFCILKAITELCKKGAFASALIKKRRYWPKHVDGDAIAAHFADKPIGATDALRGTTDGVPFHTHALKEPDHVLSLMSTYGTMEGRGKDNKRAGGISFKYPEVVHNHYTYRDAVDDNNKCRMYPIAIEESNKMQCWPTRVMNFLLGVTEVNTRRAASRIFGSEEHSQIEFRRRLAKELINNPYIQPTEEVQRVTPRKRPAQVHHGLEAMPRDKTFSHGRLVPCKTPYIQLKCSGCTKKIRTFCACNPGLMLCNDCWVQHILSLVPTD